MLDDESSPTFGKFLAHEQLRVARKSMLWLLLYVAAITVYYSYLDHNFPAAYWSYLWLSIFAFAATYLMLNLVMDCAGLPVRGGIGTFLAVTLVAGLLSGIGMLVFIVPGLYLTMRWLPVSVHCLVSKDWIGPSMRWSWEGTRPYQKQMSIALIGPFGLMYAGYPALWISEASEVDLDAAYLAFVIGINLASAAGFAWLLLLSVAAYSAIVRFQAQQPRP